MIVHHQIFMSMNWQVKDLLNVFITSYSLVAVHYKILG